MLRWARGGGSGVCGRRRCGFLEFKGLFSPALCDRATEEDVLRSSYRLTESEEKRILFLFNMHRCDWNELRRRSGTRG